MSHEAIDNRFSYADVQYTARLANGVAISSSSSVAPGTYVADFAPKSIHNARRSDGTRPPSNWARRGGVMRGVTGLYQRNYMVGDTLYTDRWTGLLASPAWMPGHSGLPSPYPQGELEAIRKALGRFSESRVQLGAALREAKQTSSMVARYYKGSYEATDKLVNALQKDRRARKSMKSFAQHGWKQAPSFYLEYLFGIKPLADDLTNAVQVLHDSKQHGGSFNLTLRGKFKGVHTERVPAYSSRVPYVNRIKADVTATQTSRASLSFHLPDWYWDRLPPVTFFREAWETTRLSFVIDWALPVNTWLMGFEGNQLRPFFREGSRSTLVHRVVSGNFVPDPGWVGRTDGGFEYKYDRTAFTKFPTGELFSLPRFRAILGLDQLRVGSALLGQKLAQLARTIARN